MIRSFLHKGLAELWETGTSARIRPDLVVRVVDGLNVLDAAENLTELDVPGFPYHRLHGRPVRHSLRVNGPWRITFEWHEGEARRVDLDQYH